MTEFLLRLFVPDFENSADPDVRSAVGGFAGMVGIAGNALLCAGKLAAGVLAGSVSIVADGLNNLSDAAASGIALLGFRMARRPADENHPFGHARFEYLSGLAVAVMILVIGFNLARSSAGRILRPEPLETSALTFGILAASVAVKGWLWRFYKKTGGMTGSGALKATAADCRNDMIATAAVLASCCAERLTGAHIDGWTGLAVALFILWSGVGTLREAVTPILGRRPDGELVAQLSGMILSRDQVMGMHDLLVHDYGPGCCYASAHVELSAQISPLEGHAIMDGIEREALETLNVHLVLHCDPVERR